MDITALKKVPASSPFTKKLSASEIEVLPLVDGVENFSYEALDRKFASGWCSYYYEFADVPEVELFSGGINGKTPNASALWRQGNLLHFGFEQSPAELNETGKAMLINSIVYISRFSEDRPIDYSPSVFAGKPIARTRARAKRPFVSDSYNIKWAEGYYSEATLQSFEWQNREVAKKWYEEMGDWLHPGAERLLEVDEQARQLGIRFNHIEFFPQAIEAMKDDDRRESAAEVLARYAPQGPGAAASREQWQTWWQENGSYLFYSEMGGYRWYLDPLAKKRGIPTKDLRGPERADVAGE